MEPLVVQFGRGLLLVAELRASVWPAHRGGRLHTNKVCRPAYGRKPRETNRRSCMITCEFGHTEPTSTDCQ